MLRSFAPHPIAQKSRVGDPDMLRMTNLKLKKLFAKRICAFKNSLLNSFMLLKTLFAKQLYAAGLWVRRLTMAQEPAKTTAQKARVTSKLISGEKVVVSVGNSPLRRASTP